MSNNQFGILLGVLIAIFFNVMYYLNRIVHLLGG